jgi:signal transduction histidine kinase
MSGEGTLRLVLTSDADHGIVEVHDSGTGMPPDVVEHAFDAFFSTKDVGKGTGLGLDIARRIVVQRHGGTIDIESEPGHTVVRVRVPKQAQR